MSANKLLVISMDALIQEDLEYLSQKPAFQKLMQTAATVKYMHSIYPTLTYPCHATMATGCLPAKHGVINNLHMIPGEVKPPWLWYHDTYQVRDLFDAAKDAGLTTAAIGWPTTGKHPHVDYLVSEIAATSAKTTAEFRRDYLATGTTPALWDAVCKQHIHLRTDARSVSRFNAATCCTIIEKYAPDLTMLHVGEPDHHRHLHGVFSPNILPALDLCEEILGNLLDAIERSGYRDSYNLVITADHGQLDTLYIANPNVLLAQNGFLEMDSCGNIADWQAWCLQTGMCAEVFVKNPAQEAAVYALLQQHLSTPGYQKIYTREEAAKEGFSGPFAFVLETDGQTQFDNHWQGAYITHHGHTKGCHGYHPDRGPHPTLLAIGPAFRSGAAVSHAHLTDGAPTWAAILGLSLPDADGRILTELLQA